MFTFGIPEFSTIGSFFLALSESTIFVSFLIFFLQWRHNKSGNLGQTAEHFCVLLYMNTRLSFNGQVNKHL